MGLIDFHRELCKDLFKNWSNLDNSNFSVETVSGGITNLCGYLLFSCWLFILWPSMVPQLNEYFHNCFCTKWAKKKSLHILLFLGSCDSLPCILLEEVISWIGGPCSIEGFGKGRKWQHCKCYSSIIWPKYWICHQSWKGTTGELLKAFICNINKFKFIPIWAIL